MKRFVCAPFQHKGTKVITSYTRTIIVDPEAESTIGVPMWVRYRRGRKMRINRGKTPRVKTICVRICRAEEIAR